MLQLDVLSAYAIAGEGAFVSEMMMWPAQAGDNGGRQALRHARFAFAILGIGLAHPLLLGRDLPLWSQAMFSASAVAAVVGVCWSLAWLSGERPRETVLWATQTGIVVVNLAIMPAGTRALGLAGTWGMWAASLLTLWLGRRLLLRPRDVNERILGALMVIFAASCWWRLGYTLAWDGPMEVHLLHAPPQIQNTLALLYGVLMPVFTMMLLNVVNARLQAELRQRAMTDHLTGTLSRHALAEASRPLIERLRADITGLAVVMIDLDHFKDINDQHGHATGDAVLREAAEAMRAQLRPGALLVRFGGEEFLALVPVPDPGVALQISERLRQTLALHDWSRVLPGPRTVTASVGFTLLGTQESIELAMARADEALYRAKSAGRNAVHAG